MIKNVSANKTLSFVFEMYCLCNKHRTRKIHCVFGRSLNK